MINQNLYFLQTAISIITRAQSLYKSPFELAEGRPGIFDREI